MVYDSVMIESRQVSNESLLTDKFVGCDNVVVEHLDESALNDDPVGNIDVDDSDDSEPILWFNRTMPTMKPAKLPCTRRIKTTTSPTVPLTICFPRP